VQYTSAGTGIEHSEYNEHNIHPLHLLQVWLKPHTLGVTPCYQVCHFDNWADKHTGGALLHVLSPDGREGSIRIQSQVDVFLYSGGPGEDVVWELASGHQCYVHVISGIATVSAGEETLTLSTGDAIAMRPDHQPTARSIIFEPLARLHSPSSEPLELILFDMGREEEDWDSMDVTKKFAKFLDAHHAQRRALLQNL
jgi:redox-sensitive bicupin YhaK (pirin superfamily)